MPEGIFCWTVVMETMEYTCAQSFISICTIEKCLRPFVAGGCHGNYLSVMGAM